MPIKLILEAIVGFLLGIVVALAIVISLPFILIAIKLYKRGK